jgi:MFS family permease
MNRPFAKFWAGQTVSELGDRVTELALPVIAVVTLSATPTQVGLLTAAVWAPSLLSLLVGSWVDRRPDRRRLLIAADLLRAMVLLSLPLAHWLGVVTLGQLFAVALLSGFGQVLFHSAYASFFVGLVDQSEYVAANSRLSTSRSASFVAGPAIGGFLIQVLTAPVAVLFDAVSFLWSALLISRIRSVPAVPSDSDTHLLADAREGLTYVLRHPFLRAGLGCVTTVNFFGFVAQALIILFATRTLGLPVGWIGLALGVGAIGGLAGAVLAPRLSRRLGVGRVIFLGAFLFPAPTVAIALAGGPHWLAAAILTGAEAVAGAAVMLMDINLNSVIFAVTQDRVRGRVSGVFGMINYGARPLGAVLGGVLGSTIGLRPTLLIAAVGGMLGCLWLLPSPIPGLRRLEALAPDAPLEKAGR